MNYPSTFIERDKVLLQCTLFTAKNGPTPELMANLAESSFNEVDHEESKLGKDALFTSFSLMSIPLLNSELRAALDDFLKVNSDCNSIFVKYYRYDEDGNVRTLQFSSEEDRKTVERKFIGGFE